MGFFALRISGRLLDEIGRLASGPDPRLTSFRLVGELAEQRGFRRPSYEQVRLLVRQAQRRARRASNMEVLLDVALRARHPDAFLRHVSATNTLRKIK